MKTLAVAILTAVATLLASCCGHLYEVQDSFGTRVSLEEAPSRIVSTVPSNTEILYALGLKDRVVGLTRYCGKTCDTRGKVIIVGWVTPDFQKIGALKPDLIFAFGGKQRTYLDEFRKIAPTYGFKPATVEDTFQAILDIGRLTGRDQRAEEIVREQREVLRRVQVRLSFLQPKEKMRVARVFGTSTEVMTAGGRSFLTDIIRLAGGVNVFGDADEDHFGITFERLASLDPDALIVQGEKTEAEGKRAAFEESPQFSKLKAVKNRRVLVYSCDFICHPNASIANTVEMVAKDLYPDIFKEYALGH